MSLAVPKSPPAPPPRKARGSPASVAEPDSPRAHASPSSASAREELVSALKDQRLRISSLTETLLEAQRAVDALKLEHVAEGVDGRLLAERMLSRLAAAQAMQAAAAARQAASTQVPVLFDLKEPGSVAVQSKQSSSLLEPLEALREQHRKERDAMSEAVERERLGREAMEAEELAESIGALEAAKAAHREATRLVTPTASTCVTASASPRAERRPSVTESIAASSAAELAQRWAAARAKPQRESPFVQEDTLVRQRVASAAEVPPSPLPFALEPRIEVALDAAVEVGVAERLKDERASVHLQAAAQQAEMQEALSAAVAAATAAKQQQAEQAEEAARMRMLLAGGMLGRLAMALGTVTEQEPPRPSTPELVGRADQ